MQTIEATLRQYLARNILFSDDGYPFADDVSFLDSGVVDSMNVMEIVMYTEKTFGITVQEHEIVPANFDSIANLSRYVREKIGVLP